MVLQVPVVPVILWLLLLLLPLRLATQVTNLQLSVLLILRNPPRPLPLQRTWRMNFLIMRDLATHQTRDSENRLIRLLALMGRL